MMSTFLSIKKHWRTFTVLFLLAAILAWKFNQEIKLLAQEYIMPYAQNYLVPMFDVIKTISKLI